MHSSNYSCCRGTGGICPCLRPMAIFMGLHPSLNSIHCGCWWFLTKNLNDAIILAIMEHHAMNLFYFCAKFQHSRMIRSVSITCRPRSSHLEVIDGLWPLPGTWRMPSYLTSLIVLIFNFLHVIQISTQISFLEDNDGSWLGTQR